MRLYFNLNKITYLFLMQALYLCIACEEPFDVGMPIPEDAIVFDGVITDEPPPYYFVLSKPSTKLKYPENRSFDRINDAEIVIVDLTTGIRDTLQNAKLTGYQDFRFYDHYRDKDVTVYMKWLPGETPGGLYVTNKIYGVENHTYELHIKYKGKEYTACERMVPKTPIDKIVMKRIDTGEGEPNETPCISFIILLKSITIICLKQIFVLQKCFVSHLFIIYIMEQRIVPVGHILFWMMNIWRKM